MTQDPLPLFFFSFFSLCLLTNGLTRWEKRTLSCNFDDCQLSVSDGEFYPAQCHLDRDGKHSCDLLCPLADRDSVISKSPPSNRKCIRFHTYNTERSATGGWSMWRSKECSKQEVILEVHCGFPEKE